jgi:hypothetical protein
MLGSLASWWLVGGAELSTLHAGRRQTSMLVGGRVKHNAAASIDRVTSHSGVL